MSLATTVLVSGGSTSVEVQVCGEEANDDFSSILFNWILVYTGKSVQPIVQY